MRATNKVEAFGLQKVCNNIGPKGVGDTAVAFAPSCYVGIRIRPSGTKNEEKRGSQKEKQGLAMSE